MLGSLLRRAPLRPPFRSVGQTGVCVPRGSPQGERGPARVPRLGWATAMAMAVAERAGAAAAGMAVPPALPRWEGTLGGTFSSPGCIPVPPSQFIQVAGCVSVGGRRHPEPVGCTRGRRPSRTSPAGHRASPRGDRPGAVTPSLVPLAPPRNGDVGANPSLCARRCLRRGPPAVHMDFIISLAFLRGIVRGRLWGWVFFFLPIAKFLVTVPGPPQLPHFGLFSFVLPNAKHVRGPPPVTLRRPGRWRRGRHRRAVGAAAESEHPKVPMAVPIAESGPLVFG